MSENLKFRKWQIEHASGSTCKQTMRHKIRMLRDALEKRERVQHDISRNGIAGRQVSTVRHTETEMR